MKYLLSVYYYTLNTYYYYEIPIYYCIGYYSEFEFSIV